MKNEYKKFISVWAGALILFNVIAFIVEIFIKNKEFSPSFWIGYAAIIIAFVGQLLISHKAFKTDNMKKMFLNVSLITISYSGLVSMIALGTLTMFIPRNLWYIGVIACAVVLFVYFSAVTSAEVAVESIENIDKKIKTQTFFIKSLTVDAEVLMSKATTTEIKNECNKVYEAVRYSDPMSNDMLSLVENQIAVKFSEFSDAVNKSESKNINAVSKELLSLIEERNKKCKLLK